MQHVTYILKKIFERFKPIEVSWHLSGKFLKDGSHVLARPITQLCHLSIKLSSFPKSCKIATVETLFKKGSKTDPQNYRPISLLPVLKDY